MDLDVEACRQAFVEDLGYSEIDRILDPCHQKGILGDLEEGTVTAEEFRSAIIAEARPGILPEDVDKALWRILVGVEPSKVALLKKLSKRFDLYMLSNNNPVCLPRSEKIFEQSGLPVSEYFRKCYFSFRMKSLKPSAAFYKAVIEDIGLPAEELLFIDDSARNVDGAIAAGLPAVYYEPGTDLSKCISDALGDPTVILNE